MDKEKRLKDLADDEEHARSTLRKLDDPKGILENIWWFTSYMTHTRMAWRSNAYRWLREIKEERERLERE